MNPAWTAAASGLVTGAALIVAIGAQNAFVLVQGIRRRHVGPIVAVCALSDAALIGAGVAGMGGLVTAAPAALTVLRWLGASFLVAYGLLAARRALRPAALEQTAVGPTTVRAAVATALAFTWLNPHVYLDTLVFLGSVGAGHDGQRSYFWGGASAASLLWFTGLGYGGPRLAPLIARPSAWRVLDAAIAVVMLTLGATVALRG